MKTMDNENRITTTVRMTKEEAKELRMFCLQNDVTLNDFLKNAADYCMNHKILPKPKK